MEVDHEKKKFTRKMKHKAEEQQGQGRDARNYMMNSRITNRSAWLGVEKAGKQD